MRCIKNIYIHVPCNKCQVNVFAEELSHILAQLHMCTHTNTHMQARTHAHMHSHCVA